MVVLPVSVWVSLFVELGFDGLGLRVRHGPSERYRFQYSPNRRDHHRRTNNRGSKGEYKLYTLDVHRIK